MGTELPRIKPAIELLETSLEDGDPAVEVLIGRRFGLKAYGRDQRWARTFEEPGDFRFPFLAREVSLTSHPYWMLGSCAPPRVQDATGLSRMVKPRKSWRFVLQTTRPTLPPQFLFAAAFNEYDAAMRVAEHTAAARDLLLYPGSDERRMELVYFRYYFEM